MPRYRTQLPQLGGKLFLTDGGLETELIFHDGIELACFASFVLLREKAGRERLRRYYARYVELARATGAGFVLESPTWRANADWAAKLGYTAHALDAANREGIKLMAELRDAYETPALPMVISGCVGPRGDGYDPGKPMSADEAEHYHTDQIRIFARTEADMVTPTTMTSAAEAIGATRAARATGMPVAVSFTLETDGRLPTGQALGDAIEEVDAATAAAPAYYMINCAHPTHFAGMLFKGGAWLKRLRGLRGNASKKSHVELDASDTLDIGEPAEFGAETAALRRRLPHINVLGGCCGTDHRHIGHAAEACRVAE